MWIEKYVFLTKGVLIVQIQVHVLITENIYFFRPPGCTYMRNELRGQH